MRRAAVLVCLVVAGEAASAPRVVGRVGMVARGELAPDVIGDGSGDGRALVTARVRGGADRLRRAGFDARPLTDTTVELRLVPDELRRLLANPDVSVVEERRLLHPLLDQSAPAVGAPQARLESGLDGSGVLVGVVDTGVDFRHRDLRRPDGTTRIAALLDVANPRTLHPDLPDYNGAALWLRGDVDAVLAAEADGTVAPLTIAQTDSNGHGTHVAGIAVSNGLATGNGLPAGRYVGIAPGAELVIVQATHGGNSFTDSDVITGCRFAVDEAAREGKPIVVNLSLGGPGGPHDGSSDLEIALDELFPGNASGRALVIAAGNDGDLDRHAGGWSLDGELDVPVTLPVAYGQGQLSFELWYSGSLSIELTPPTGDGVGPVAQGHSLTSRNGLVAIDNGAATAREPNGRQGASISIAGPSGAGPTVGTYTLRLRGRAPRWDAWIVDEPGPTGVARFTAQIAEDDRLALPATGHNAVIVGSFVSRTSWVTHAGEHVDRGGSVGVPSDFTPSGPTADGRFAPDVLAPGEHILSALSADAPATSMGSAFYIGSADPQFAVADDGLHGVLRGTSQATPHVSGALALLLQADPQLTASQLREIVRVTAHDDGRGFTPHIGFGKLDVLAAVRYATREPPGTIAVSPATSSVSVSRDLVAPGNDVTVATVTPRAGDGTPLGPGHHVIITSSAGSPVGPVVDTGAGRYERTFRATAPRGSVATITATVDGVALSHQATVYFVVSRAEVGQPLSAGGGCSLSSASIAPGGTLLVALFAVAALTVAQARKSRRRRLRRTLRG